MYNKKWSAYPLPYVSYTKRQTKQPKTQFFSIFIRVKNIITIHRITIAQPHKC
jgi:hypothetical protein